MTSEKKRKLLRSLPSVDRVMSVLFGSGFFKKTPKSELISFVRSSIDGFRTAILADSEDFKCHDAEIMQCVIDDVKCRVSDMQSPSFRRVINATGVVLHTNLGRSPLSNDISKILNLVSSYYSNLEYDLVRGSRGTRHNVLEPILCRLSGAEAAFVVNNNAAAVLVCLNTMANLREVIISRGELVEIGDSFRIPDIMSKSGSILTEVGTTNCTHIRDYCSAITENTSLLMKVHTSNYGIVGFTSSVALSDLVKLGESKSIPVMEDLGSGTFIDFSKYGLVKEPTVQESLASGVDIVTFSGDKLLGGPQSGIILGKKRYIDLIKKNSLARVLRVDKMTSAALEGTLRFYYDEKEAIKKIPVLKMLLQPVSTVEKRARDLYSKISLLFKEAKCEISAKIFDSSSCAGGGSLPLVSIPSKCLGIRIDGLSVNEIEKIMRKNSIPIIGRIENDFYILDFRTISCSELEIIEKAFQKLKLNFLS